MKIELQNKLFEKYPSIFQQRKLPMTQTCMCWGIETGDGWYDLIDKLCEELIKTCPKIQASQVKEKFGGLRFYTWNSNDKAENLIDKAENDSYKICEICGNSGKPNNDGWISTLCDSCRDKK